eukprot:CAMPEP_0194140186 /NCGR_PEP_ID=MMETSP0152-20130528/9763_1 /TAXON_ID=1049557 /ORGANISM="Thalassiothrix antarctica, Strain L6-D1" /LENGTH=145 /DNA_ID=CAMNT_0038838333 /DNA_START=259 /DNA_END=696 /DNA_ORIENTATION=-
MGFFDGISKAFTNQDYKVEDQRVRASHILIKGDDDEVVFDTTKRLLLEINERQGKGERLGTFFAEIARRESSCNSADKGGDLGLFGAGTMVKEFDEVLFDSSPPVGTILGPVITDFGSHIILVTQREENRDQVEEKLARIDKDAR